MNRSGPTRIRNATSEDIPRAIAAIVTAFTADPPARFAWPSAHDYLVNMPLATREFAGSCFEHGTAYVAADCSGAALWLPPGVEPDGKALERMFRDTAMPEHLEDLLATFEQMGQSHPREPHWYLPQIGVDPSAQGNGIGAALMQYALARCDKDQALAYLEASKPQNIPFYQRHGFEVTGEIQVGTAPPVTPMVRKPRGPPSAP
jgi:ribosomal protein S18 acetylase RimI-like enzyme